MRSRRVSLPPGRNVFNNIINPFVPYGKSNAINAVSLGNGKIIVILNARIVNTPEDSEIYFILDQLCTNIKYFEIRHDRNRRLIRLLPYHDTFDLFYVNFTDSNNNQAFLNAPQRYNDQGEQIKLNFNFTLETYLDRRQIEVSKLNEVLDAFQIQTIMPNDASEGYVSTIKTNDKIKVKVLNSNFEVIKESDQEYSYIRALSVNNGNVSLCYVNRTYHCFCELLDGELKNKTRVLLTDPWGHFPNKVSITSTPDSGGIVGHADISKGDYFLGTFAKQQPLSFYIRRINPDGSTNELVDLGTRSVSMHFEMQGFLMENKEFCLVTTAKINPQLRYSRIRSISVDCIRV
ncbi:hypothetical protein TSAR_004740 [Trichomalopsis sarcophagae]|uniref:Uncharacterized protein n=1 Tax=Trichomalopsis sarcophagae TaxID=543379 RepID=A0A232FFB4_9HYME|nr:hypothetical protein TSAR_004740 [Trichomalopsis sarcophagae]